MKFPFAINAAAVGLAKAGSKEKVEYPLEPSARTEQLINFNDRLGMAGVTLAGVLQPPPGTRRLEQSPFPPGAGSAKDAAKASADLLAAEAFSRDPKTWYPSIEPILARLATQIRFWQIGGDRDPGWIGCGDLAGIVSRTKATLDRIGQNLEIGIAWNLATLLPPPPPTKPLLCPPIGSRHRGVSCHCPATTASAMTPSRSAWTARNRRASRVGSCWMRCPERPCHARRIAIWSNAC